MTGFYLNHANAARYAQTENIGYLIEISGKKILHVGDTNWNEDLFVALNLEKEHIDIAILPYCLTMYEEGVEVIKKYIQPKQIIATHISPFEKETVTNGIRFRCQTLFAPEFCKEALFQRLYLPKCPTPNYRPTTISTVFTKLSARSEQK